MTTAVIGESLVDLVWRTGAAFLTPSPGGSPTNVAVGLHRLGEPVELMTTWGEDPAGAQVREYLRGTGVPISRATSESARTTLAMAYVDDSTGTATYDFLPYWDPADLPVGEDVDMVHTGSLAIVVQPGAERVLERCRLLRRRRGVTIAVDLNVRPAVQPDRTAYQQAVEQLLEVTDVVKASDEDLMWLYPDDPPEQVARELLALGPVLVVLTRGAAGAVAFVDGQEVSVPAPRVEVADSIGAGDAFQACLLAELRRWRRDEGGGLPPDPASLEKALRRCATAGALASRVHGAQPPTRDEIHVPPTGGEAAATPEARTS